MRLSPSRLLLISSAVFIAALASGAVAAPIPVKIELPIIRTAQLYTMGKEGDANVQDDVYVFAQGIAKGTEFQKRLPEQGTLKVAQKKPAENVGAVWEGELNDGEFVFATVVLMQGTGKDAAKLKQFQDKLSEAAKKAPERSKKTLTTDESDKLIDTELKADREVITHIKDTFARDKNTDHYGGLFNLIVWNNGGKLVKRLDPVGLTFGEHYGVDAKIYTKLKYTRANILEKDKAGDFNEVQFPPVDDDNPNVVRVKMLETEYVKVGDQSIKKVTDYLVDVRVTAGGKVQTWSLGDEQTGPGTLHTYWNYAE